jgi:hypothetical protein
VLAGLNKRIGGDVQTIALVDANSVNETIAALKGGQ